MTEPSGWLGYPEFDRSQTLTFPSVHDDSTIWGQTGLFVRIYWIVFFGVLFYRDLAYPAHRDMT